jgi:hypothetical protein
MPSPCTRSSPIPIDLPLSVVLPSANRPYPHNPTTVPIFRPAKALPHFSPSPTPDKLPSSSKPNRHGNQQEWRFSTQPPPPQNPPTTSHKHLNLRVGRLKQRRRGNERKTELQRKNQIRGEK